MKEGCNIAHAVTDRGPDAYLPKFAPLRHSGDRSWVDGEQLGYFHATEQGFDPGFRVPLGLW
jgi:hypothetical protein